MTENDNEPTTLAERLSDGLEGAEDGDAIPLDEAAGEVSREQSPAVAMGKMLSRVRLHSIQTMPTGQETHPEMVEEMYSDTDSTPSEATDAAVSRSMDKSDERMFPTEKSVAWRAWRAAWNKRGSTDRMSDLEERTARTAFGQWWEKEA